MSRLMVIAGHIMSLIALCVIIYMVATGKTVWTYEPFPVNP